MRGGKAKFDVAQAVKGLKDPSRPETVTFFGTAAIISIVIFLHWLDAVAGWVATMVVSMLQLLAGI
jgi:hypothetical protein